MREILFRGKRIDSREWVEGGYRHEKVGEYLTAVLIIEPLTMGVWENHRVNPETVGQFTGLTDKNGKRIFEGDIVEGHIHSQWRHDVQRCVVAYGRDGFECRHHIGGIDTPFYTYRVMFSKDVAVIGNIHDNPELLEVEHEDKQR